MKAILLFGTLAAAFSTAFADADRGKVLHDENCMKCHGTEVYTREDRFVGNSEALTAQVKRCNMNVGTEWNDGQIEDVVQYLDRAFYKFQ
ncbi:MAG: cytochrome c [Thiogranum sp.]|nr:cytochrome c [Thiogranum sp.]